MSNQVHASSKGPNDVLPRLFAVLDTLGSIARRMHPAHLALLVATLADQDQALRTAVEKMTPAPSSIDKPDLWDGIRRMSCLTLQACDGLRGALRAENPSIEAYRAMRRYSRALETLTDNAETNSAIGRYLLEPAARDDPAILTRMAALPHPDTGVFHFRNEISERGGFSVYVPAWYDPAHPLPVVMALHGGAGHGRLFLWNWIPEARTRGLIIIAPTAIGSTWSLMESEIDSANLLHILAQVGHRWSVDTDHLLLTGMSDGGTFTLLSGLDETSPFTHLAPIAAAFHPLLLTMTEPARLSGLPIYLVHGAMDWMFPVDLARTANRALTAAGAMVTYREIADLSHAYPRDEQGAMLDWLLVPKTDPKPS